jgi:hypothetical protein
MSNTKNTEEKINLYLSEIEYDKYDFVAELETLSVSELEKMAGKITERYSDDYRKNALLSRLLEFVLTFRKLHLDRQFSFNQENIDKIAALDKQLQTFLSKIEKEVEKIIAFRTKLMKYNQDIRRISVGVLLYADDWIDATGIDSFMDINYFYFFRTKDLYWTVYDSDTENNSKLDRMLSFLPNLSELSDETITAFPFFDFSSQYKLGNQIKIKHIKDDYGRKTVVATFDAEQKGANKCSIGAFLYFIHKYSLFSLSDMLCVKKINCNVNDILYECVIR